MIEVRVLSVELAKDIDSKFQKAKVKLTQLDAITKRYNSYLPIEDRITTEQMNEILGGYEVVE